MKGLLSHQENPLGNRVEVSAWVSIVIVTVCLSASHFVCVLRSQGSGGPTPALCLIPAPSSRQLLRDMTRLEISLRSWASAAARVRDTAASSTPSSPSSQAETSRRP